MKIIVVNDKDEVVGYKDRDDRNTTDIIRVAGLWLFNSKREVLIAQRSLSKIHDPGKWGPSAAGTVEEGETYTSNIIKEAKEELGIFLDEHELEIGSPRLVHTDHRYFVLLHFAKCNFPISGFEIQKDEVEQVRWISVVELAGKFKSDPKNFTAAFKTSLKELQLFVSSSRSGTTY